MAVHMLRLTATAGFWAELTVQFDGGSLAVRKPAGSRQKSWQSKGNRWLWAYLTAQVGGASLAVHMLRWTATEQRAVKGNPPAFGLTSRPNLTETPWLCVCHDGPRLNSRQSKGTRWLWAELTAQVHGAPLAFARQDGPRPNSGSEREPAAFGLNSQPNL